MAALDRNKPVSKLLSSVGILQINSFVNPVYALLIQTGEILPGNTRQ